MPGSAGSNISGADGVPAGQPPGRPANDLYTDALRGALTLVHANGGEIATLGSAPEVFVSRARLTHPRLDPAQGQAAPASRPRRESVAPAQDSGIDGQPTQVLPSSHATPTYQLGEGLIGAVVQRGAPMIISGDEYRQLHRGAREAEGQSYLAVPIFRPGDLSALRGDQGIIGVIAVYNRDPHWSFTQRDTELLTLHADRVARRMMNDELRRSIQIQSVLIEILRGVEESGAEASATYQRVREAVHRTISAPSFALIRFDTAVRVATLATFEIAERDGRALQSMTREVIDLPAWWHRWVAEGKTLRRVTHEDYRMHPEEFALGWGGDAHAKSLIATPMIHGTHKFGALVVGSPHPNAYTEEHQGALEAIARTTAVVLENMRLLDAAATRAKQLAALNNAVLALNATLNLDAIADALAKHAVHLTSASAVGVFLRAADGKSFVARAIEHRAPTRGASLPLQEIVIPHDWRYVRDLPASEQIVLLEKIESEWEENTGLARFLKEQQVRSFLIAPIIPRGSASGGTQGKIVGLLMVYTPDQPSPFERTSHETGQLQALTERAASAISNAMLYADLAAALERQKELDRLKDEFILTISHEFRTPLTAIEGYGSLFNKYGDKLEVEKAKRFADEIHRATVQLNGMITMLSDANRLSSQPLQVSVRPVRVREAIDQALYNQAPKAHERITIEAPESLQVLADPERLASVFSNLLSNAVKYAEHGPIIVSAQEQSRAALARAGRLTSAQSDAPERWVELSVQDTGPGIPKEDIEKLFQKFVRLSRSLTTSVRGTGLGLWICQQYVQAMGGEIWVESEPGQGARFAFCLPAAPIGRRGG
jgi:signal transduction histidine kinase